MAGLPVLSGWLIRRPAQAAASGIAVCLFALLAHYGLGRAFGLFGPAVWAENCYWFQAATILGGPLGLVGAAARRHDLWGLAARLLVPAAAVLEPFRLGMFTEPAIMPWANRLSSMVSRAILLLAGSLAAAAIVQAAAWKSRACKEPP